MHIRNFSLTVFPAADPLVLLLDHVDHLRNVQVASEPSPVDKVVLTGHCGPNAFRTLATVGCSMPFGWSVVAGLDSGG